MGRLLSHFRDEALINAQSLFPPRRHVLKNLGFSFVSTRRPIFAQEGAICMFDFT